ncbi:SMP-30/gluconolactonase/LRE family protein [Collinsella vaginalis]|uniref:SMP-30/gluconolactonase/LRE family protein n=1 Tax=Collinsella vaginalis TaxID=1870987 RepID=UPI000A26D016|nr:SMP-30/gluconolactonase/LRE family protein [Collinsella vaginalis]
MGNEQQKVDGVIDTTGFPVPPAEQNLPAMWAEHVCDVGEGGGILEGLCFDRTGILWFVDCPHALIYRLDSADPAPKPEVAFKMPEGGLPSAVKIHKDGRLFITCVMSDRGPGIFVMSTEGAVLDCISAGERWVDDMVFLSDGNLLYTTLDGTMGAPTAGVYHVDVHTRETTCLASGMIATNGIALTPDERGLWMTEYGRGLLHFWELADDKRSISTCGSWVAYHFTGLEGPDSACIDADGNLYVAVCGQGRYLAFNSQGIPVRQYLIPGRELYQMDKSTHPQVRPGTDELWMCASDTRGGTGRMALYKEPALAGAYRNYQFQ